MADQRWARNLQQQEPGRESRHADATAISLLAQSGDARQKPDATCTHETADAWSAIVAYPAVGWRVIVCRDGLQWILQRRKNGGAERPWRAVGYLQTREALVRLCATSCGPLDPIALAALTALPAIIGREGTP